MPVPRVYRRSGNRPIVSYDFTDIAVGTGYKTLYGLGMSGGTFFGTSAIDSDADFLSSSFSAVSTATLLLGEKNFDLEFDNTFQTIQGQVLINSTLDLGITGGATTGYGY